jgi:TolB-like protein/tetratricopeptide (TPR) repeat protein
MSLFAELKRRNVIRVAVAYAIVAWVIAQVAEFAFENFGAPDWVLKSVVVVLLLGLPLALFFAWAFEMTPDGIKREEEVDRSASIVGQTGRKLDRMIIGVLVLALGWFAFDKFSGDAEIAPPMTAVEQIADIQPREKSVAVLPFVAMSSGPDDEYFADGLTEEILNSLAQLPELLVTARTSAFSFKGQDLPIQEIAEVLGVNHVVEGSVRRSGDRLRVTAQLIRANDGFHLWSENYDSTSTDTISVQENIAEKIASVMDVVLDEEKRAAMRAVGLRDVEAFTAYQKGLEFYELAHGEMEMFAGLQQANTYFEQVIERAPTFSDVYLAHSDLYTHALNVNAAGIPIEELITEDVATAYQIAIADYSAATLHSTSATQKTMLELDLAYFSGDWQGLDRRIERSLATTACESSNWLQVIADVFGYTEQFIERARRILACDPRRSLSWFNLARSTLRSGDSAEAVRIAREGMAIAPGAWLRSSLVRSLVANGQFDEALKETDRKFDDLDLELMFKALIAAEMGDQALFDELFEKFKVANTSGNEWLIMVAAWGGKREEANRAAAAMDQHAFGSIALSQLAQWCACGHPFDLEVTPNLAAKLEESGMPWPPKSIMEYPLKDW